MNDPTTASAPRFPGLDSLRALASISVVATHTSFWAGVYGYGVLGAATQRLEVGVAVFFVLSGFLLSYPYLTGLRSGRPHDSFGRYLFKRALRIMPVYWVTMIATLVLLPANRDLGVDRWISNIALVDVFVHPLLPRGFTQMWSLSTEATFYLVLPALMAGLVVLVCRRRWSVGRLLTALAVLSLASLVWTAVTAAGFHDTANWARRGLPSYLIWFAVGIGFAVLDVDRRSRRAAPGRLLRGVTGLAMAPGTCWLLAAALFTIASTPLAGSPELIALGPGENVVRTTLYTVVAGLVVLPSIFGDPGSAYARVLALPVLRHLGHISYSLFCCHMLILELATGWFDFPLFQTDPFLLFAVILVISLVVAEVLYRCVELPFLRLKNAFGATAPAATQPSATSTSS
jgi:peptidoglycan/LPS O-acetylase OafA/YrhL